MGPTYPDLHQSNPQTALHLAQGPQGRFQRGATLNRGPSWERHQSKPSDQTVSEPIFFTDSIVSDRYLTPAKFVYRGQWATAPSCLLWQVAH